VKFFIVDKIKGLLVLSDKVGQPTYRVELSDKNILSNITENDNQFLHSALAAVAFTFLLAKK